MKLTFPMQEIRNAALAAMQSIIEEGTTDVGEQIRSAVLIVLGLSLALSEGGEQAMVIDMAEMIKGLARDAHARPGDAALN